MEQNLTNAHPDLITLGVITEPHGLKGEVKIKYFTHTPTNFSEYNVLYDSNGKEYKLKISAVNKNRIIAHIKNVNNRTQAEKLAGTYLLIKRAQLPALTEEEYYHIDLIGLNVLVEDKVFGCIKAIHNFGSTDVLEIIILETNKSEYFAFSKDNVIEVNILEKYIKMVLPEIV